MSERTIHLDKEIFDLVKTGKKKFEVRLGNKDINLGDKLIIIQRDVEGNETKNKLIKKAGIISQTKNITFWPEEEIKKHGLKIIQLEDLDQNE
jgi:ASC-1-like (ASCH) protein